jgi:hypothetical protein
MIVFTTLDYWSRRGVHSHLSRRYGRGYKIVLIGSVPIVELGRHLSASRLERVVDGVPTREDVARWLRHHDGAGKPWPRYAVEGI